jgi:hypothetical protein
MHKIATTEYANNRNFNLRRQFLAALVAGNNGKH